jgi:hypothetical protein
MESIVRMSRIATIALLVIVLSSIVACGTNSEQQPTSTPTVTIRIVNSSLNINPLLYEIVVEVENNNSVTVTGVEINATLYNSVGTVIRTRTGSSCIRTLMPNQKAPVYIWGTLNITPQIDHYELTVSNLLITNDQPYREFSVLSSNSSIDSIGFYLVSGELENSGDQVAHWVNVIGTFYDDKGNIIDLGSSFAQPRDLSPGQIASFGIILPDAMLSPNISSYTLQVECE